MHDNNVYFELTTITYCTEQLFLACERSEWTKALSSLPVDARKYIRLFGNWRNVLYVWGLMICMTFMGMNKPRYNKKHSNFLRLKALA